MFDDFLIDASSHDVAGRQAEPAKPSVPRQSLGTRGWRLLEQVDDLVGQSLFPKHNVHLAGRSNLLEYFEFAQAH